MDMEHLISYETKALSSTENHSFNIFKNIAKKSIIILKVILQLVKVRHMVVQQKETQNVPISTTYTKTRGRVKSPSSFKLLTSENYCFIESISSNHTPQSIHQYVCFYFLPMTYPTDNFHFFWEWKHKLENSLTSSVDTKEYIIN